MSYATISDVNSYFANTSFDTNTAITQTQIEQWLTEDTNFINSRIEKTIDLTAITSDGLEILKQINALLTVFRIDKTLPYFNARTKDERSKQRNGRKEAMEMLTMIENRMLKITPDFKTDVGCNLVNTGLENFGVPEFPKEIVL